LFEAVHGVWIDRSLFVVQLALQHLETAKELRNVQNGLCRGSGALSSDYSDPQRRMPLAIV
jgi:hypothetical protein